MAGSASGVPWKVLDLRDETVLWEIEKLFDHLRSEDLSDRFFRGQVAGTGTQIELMLLPNFRAKAQRDQLQQPLGDQGAQDEDFIGVPAGRDGGLAFSGGDLQGPVGGGTTGVARQMGGPEAKAESSQERF